VSTELPAGRELNIVVAQTIIEVKKSPDAVTCRNCGEAGELYGVMPYSSDIGAAWEVVGAMASRGFGVALSSTPMGFRAEFLTGCGESAETAPHAICLAALRAVAPTQREET